MTPFTISVNPVLPLPAYTTIFVTGRISVPLTAEIQNLKISALM